VLAEMIGGLHRGRPLPTPRSLVKTEAAIAQLSNLRFHPFKSVHSGTGLVAGLFPDLDLSDSTVSRRTTQNQLKR
jgi:hypothetical protein